MGVDRLPAQPFRDAGRLLSAGLDQVDDPFERDARFVEANLQRNYTATFIHGVLGMTGFRLIHAPTIIPAYLLLITGSAAAVGLGTALLQLGAVVSPILSGARIEHCSHILPYSIRVGSVMRMAILGLALAGWLLTGQALVLVTLALFLVLGFFNGAQRVAGTVFIERAWLGNGYATTFLFAFILTSAGLVVLRTMIREPARAGFSAIRIGGPFWTVYAAQQLGLSSALIGGLSFAVLGADTVANLVWGPMGDRWGFRIVYILALLCAVGGVTVLMLATSATPIYAAFVLLGTAGSGWMLAGSTMVLEFSAHEDIPMRPAFVTTAEGMAAAAGPVLAGLLVAAAGFTPLFVLVLAALAGALAVMTFAVREPRGRVQAE